MTSVPTDHSIHILQRTRTFYGCGQRLALWHLQEAVWTTRGLGTGQENLQLCYYILVNSIEGDGFNAGIRDAVIPRAIHVERAATKAGQVAELLSSGRAFSASGQWNHCKSRIGNAGVTLQAQQQQLQTNEAARVKVADKKVRRCSRY